MRAAWLTRIDRERARAEVLCESGRLRYTAAHFDCPNDLRLAALVEEVGEVARAYHDGDRDELIRELVQTAGVAVAWLESFGEP